MSRDHQLAVCSQQPKSRPAPSACVCAVRACARARVRACVHACVRAPPETTHLRALEVRAHGSSCARLCMHASACVKTVHARARVRALGARKRIRAGCIGACGRTHGSKCWRTVANGGTTEHVLFARPPSTTMIAVMIALLPPAHRIIRAEEAGDNADERGALPLTPVIKFWLVPNCRPTSRRESVGKRQGAQDQDSPGSQTSRARGNSQGESAADANTWTREGRRWERAITMGRFRISRVLCGTWFWRACGLALSIDPALPPSLGRFAAPPPVHAHADANQFGCLAPSNPSTCNDNHA